MIKNIFSEISKNKQTFDKITEIASKARKYELKHGKENIINGTIGMFKNEDGNFFVPQIIKSLYHGFKIEDISPYSPMNSTDLFSKGIINLLNIKKYKNYVAIYPVSGGVTALHHIIHNFSDCTIITHNPFWEPYKNIVEELGLKLHSINFFKNDLKTINFEGIYKELSRYKNEKILFIINNPANNPTGISFTIKEWKNFKQILISLNKKQNLKFLLYFDLAYIDYSDYDFNTILDIFFDEFNIFAGYSISKSFSLYGFRTGAIIFFSKSVSDRRFVILKLNYSSRASTGSINTSGYKLIEKFSDNNLIEILKNEQNYIKHTISKRAEHFKSILNKFNIPFFRYDSGFFITFNPYINNKNNNFSSLLEFENKIEKKGVFFVPIKEGIRVAICSLPIKKIRLIEKIFENNHKILFSEIKK